MAACLLLGLFLGTGILYWQPGPQVVTAQVELDQKLKTLLLQSEPGRWENKERVNRLVNQLQERGVQVVSLDGVVLEEKYFASKDLFGPKEYLHVEIRNGVARIKVIQGQE
jgi:hypothetical protein